MWTDYFQKIYVINLPERFDRMYETKNLLDEYEIPFERFEATKYEHGYFGLVLTMKSMFKYCLDNGIERVLVFEDDVKFVEGKEFTNNTMQTCVNGLTTLDWGQFYLGLQHVKPFNKFVQPNILPVEHGYSTHAVAYNKHCMENFMNNYVDQPIDNYFVNSYQQFHKSFCSYPLLATQRKGFSNIGGQEIDWDIYITPNFNKFTAHLFNK